MNALDNIFLNMTLTCMLNPKNKDFYIKKLTIDKTSQFLADQPDDELVDIFWTAFSIAQSIMLCGDTKSHLRYLQGILFPNSCKRKKNKV